MHNTVAILDAGAQYGKVIDRRVRELGVRTEMVALDAPTEELEKYSGFIISGGPESVYGPKAPAYNPEIFTLGIPVLGICYGQQLINYVHGGTVEKKPVREDGQFEIEVDTDSPLFADLETNQQVLLTHGDSVDQIPEGFRVIARSRELIAGIENQEKNLYAVQFHPEVDLTINGKQILSNFLFSIVGLVADFTIEDREEKAIEYIRKKVGNNNALILISGGVDSTVTATLLTRALKPEQIFAIHVDHGFMRHNESDQVVKSLKKQGVNVKLVKAEDEFMEATTEIDGKTTPKLKQAIHPEEKRKIIGDTFMKVAATAIEDFDLKAEETYLVQGTIRPDLIESASAMASSKAQTIKTHHNDTTLVRNLRATGRVVEPLTEYHKDEVRQLGELLGLPHELVWRHPFPGPGLGIMVLCANEPYLENYDQVYEQTQAFATDEVAVTLLPIKTVGVQGDGRTYNYCAALSGSKNWDQLEKIAREIPRTIHQINRIVYMSGEPISEPVKEITPTHLTLEVLDQLREAHSIVDQVLREFEIYNDITEVPVISVPLPFGKAGNRSIAIRTIITNDYMTGRIARINQEFPVQALEKIIERILAEIEGTSRVFYDLTSKPPGTTQWE